MRDEFRGRAFLTPAQVQRLLCLRNAAALRAYAAKNPLFPKAVAVGETDKGKPRLMYRKDQIYAFIDLLPPE